MSDQNASASTPAKREYPYVFRFKTRPIFGMGEKKTLSVECDVSGVEYYVPLLPDGPIENIGGFTMRFSKRGEIDKTQIVVMLTNNHSIRFPLGDRAPLERQLRVMRSEDRQAIDELDAEIEALKLKRKQLVDAAFDRGAKPNAYELALIADANLPKQQEQLERDHAAERESKAKGKAGSRPRTYHRPK